MHCRLFLYILYIDIQEYPSLLDCCVYDLAKKRTELTLGLSNISMFAVLKGME